MISHKHKCIFIHIPKSGGSSIEEILWPDDKDRIEETLWMGFISRYHNKYQTGGLQHLFASQVRQEVGEKFFRKYFKFSIVRNPWDKAVSQFVYMKKRKDLREYISMSEEDCFRKYLSLIRKKLHVQWESQHKFLMDDNKNLLVDFVGKFESFKSDVYRILDKLKIENEWGGPGGKLPHKHKSSRSAYPDYYDSESKEMVEDMYRDDIEIFGYKF